MAKTDMSPTAATVRAGSSWGSETTIRYPSPELDPFHSAKTAPITDTATAIFAPVNTPGSAAGSSTCQKVRSLGASNVRISLSRSGSTDSRPASVVTTIEKNDTSATTISFGAIPKPSQKASTGAISTTGTACEAITSGYAARRNA